MIALTYLRPFPSTASLPQAPLEENPLLSHSRGPEGPAALLVPQGMKVDSPCDSPPRLSPGVGAAPLFRPQEKDGDRSIDLKPIPPPPPDEDDEDSEDDCERDESHDRLLSGAECAVLELDLFELSPSCSINVIPSNTSRENSKTALLQCASFLV